MIAQNILLRIANALRNELVLVCPVDTGRLVGSIEVIPTEKGLLISMVEYGKFVEYGSNPRIIRPVRRKALKFKADGRTVIVRKVRHPGIRPTYFVRNTVLDKLPGIIKREVSR